MKQLVEVLKWGGYESWEKSTTHTSLMNILKSLYEYKTGKNKDICSVREEIRKGRFNIVAPNELFENLEKQGVMFLNSALTVEGENVGGHLEIWDGFQKELTKFILKKNKTVKWVLWGDKAQEKFRGVFKGLVEELMSQDKFKKKFEEKYKEKFEDSKIREKLENTWRRIEAPHPASNNFITKKPNPFKKIEKRCGIDLSVLYDNVKEKDDEEHSK